MQENFEYIYFNLEEMKKNISERIDLARKNPIKIIDLFEINERLNDIMIKIINGKAIDKDYKERELLIGRLLDHCALTKNITEFMEMLKQLNENFGADKNWCDEILEHENAHASVSQQLGFNIIGYAIIFKENNLIQACHIATVKEGWSSIEVIDNSVARLKAPIDYGCKDKDQCKNDLAEIGGLLELKKEIIEKKDKGKLSKLRNFLKI